MDLFSHLGNPLADGRLGANLVATYGLITLIVLTSIILRRMVTHGGSRLAEWTHLRWLSAAGEEAARHTRKMLFWLTVAMLVLTIVAGIVYQVVGRDIRADVSAWIEQLTVRELLQVGLGCGEFVGVLVVTWVTVRAVKRVWPVLEDRTATWFGRFGGTEVIRHWFVLLHLYVIIAIRLIAVWAIGRAVGLSDLINNICGFLLRLLTILVIARLLTLSCRMLFNTIAKLGNRRLGRGPFRRYWERITLLFPFGERCFEAAVYVAAASLCLAEINSFAGIAFYGPALLRCIGIFFVTRVLIELLHVVLHEAFGLSGDDATGNQKGRTLVPLLHSIGQYVIYFGSAISMLQVLGISTAPILAGAGIIGLAIGLGAQNLVTDVVSGFFILFENQYLVGDFVKIGDACGIVEAVGIRLTEIRDEHGKLHIIPNGQIKGVVSYSKGYVNAVVDMKVPAGSDLEGVFRSMAEAGRRLRAAHAEVLADTHILGLIDLGTSDMTVRALTKVRPGTHGVMQNEYRRLLKQVFDQNPPAANRAALAA